MSYVYPNVKTKKMLKEIVNNGGAINVFNPGLGVVPTDGPVSIEGPHGDHKWYAEGTMKDGKLVAVR